MCQRHARFHDEEEGGATVYASHRRLCFGRVWRFSFDPKAAKVLLLLLLVKLLKAPGQNNVMCASVPFILDDLRIDDFAFARAFAIGTALAAMVQPKLGALVDFSLRFSFVVGLTGFSVGLGSLTLISAPAPLWQLILAWLFIRATAIGVLEVICAATIALHFTTFKGRATALMQVVAGLPTGALTSIMQASDLAIGWRITLRIAAVAPLLLAMASTCLLPAKEYHKTGGDGTAAEGEDGATRATKAKSSMSEMNAVQLSVASEPQKASPAPGAKQPEQHGRQGQHEQQEQQPETEAVQQDQRWLSRRTFTLCVIFFSVFWSTTIYGGIDLFSVEMARGLHADRELASYDVAAFVFLPVGLVTSVVVLMCGVFIDRGVPPHIVSACGNALSAACALCATRLDTPVGGLTYAISRGLSSGAFAATSGLLIPHFFGRQNLGRLLGGQALCYVLGTCNGSLLLGLAPGLFGSFSPVLCLFAVPALVIAVLQLMLKRISS